MGKYILVLKGKAKDVFRMLELLATTEPINHDRDWWKLRAYILASCQDKQPILSHWQRRN